MYRNVILPQMTPAMPPRVPPPSHRHGAPSGPWPFLDVDDEVDPERIEDPYSHLPMSASACDHAQTPNQEVCWCKYPQALYPNWTPRQQKKSRISKVIEKRTGSCVIRYLDVMKDGLFVNVGEREVNHSTQDTHWHAIQKGRPSGVRVRALFIDNLSGPVLQMLGTRYNIEPFFFSSTIGWIPSRYQTNVVPNESDHITITLTFIRSIQNPTTVPPSANTSFVESFMSRGANSSDLIIDTQAPLPLRSSNLLLLPDQLALHMIRSRTSNTIISLHPGPEHRATTAESLHNRVHFTGHSVYWSNIFQDMTDPTFIFLSFLWYALYAWDEALENLYSHICFLESQIIYTDDIQMTQELHVIRAHLLHYEFLLHDFKKTVTFVLQTPNPCLQPRNSQNLEDEDVSNDEIERRQAQSEATMKKECGNLLTEINRLERSREMQDKRLKNVMGLGFSVVAIEDSKRTHKLTEAAVRDSAAMKQIAYLTMVFLPSSFVATVFGMNVTVLNPESFASLSQYVAVAVPLTALTIWIIVAYQIQLQAPRLRSGGDEQDEDDSDRVSRYTYYGVGESGGDTETVKLDMWARLSWPVVLLLTIIERRKRRKQREVKMGLRT